PGSAQEKRLIERLTRAYEAGDVDGIVALFTDDAWLTMPPAPLEYQGRGPIARFLAAIAFRDGRTYRLLPTPAHTPPAPAPPPAPPPSSPSRPTCPRPGAPRTPAPTACSSSPSAATASRP